jgi:hypothetical protein
MFVADSGTDTLYQVTLPGGTRTSLGSFDFDSGYYPTGLVWDSAGGVLLMATGESSLTIRATTP